MPYSGDPAESPLDEVRFLLGDTDQVNPKLSDEEVRFLLDRYTTPVQAAFEGARRLFIRYSGMVSKTVGPTRLEYGSLAQQYQGVMDLMVIMGARKTKVPGLPTAGGLDTVRRFDFEPDESDQMKTKQGS